MTAVTFDKAYQKQILTNMSKAYLNKASNFVANLIAPTLQVNNDTGQIFGFGTQGIRNVNGARAVGARYKKVDFKVELTDQWVLKDHGFAADIFAEEEENAQSPLQARQAKARLIMDIMLLNYEIAVASQINATTIPNNTTLSGTDQWSNYSLVTPSNPIGDIDGAKETVRKACGKEPNSIMLSQDTFVILKRHPQIIEQFKNTVFVTEKMLQDIILKDVLGFENVFIGKSQFDDINLNSTALESGNDLVDVWTKIALIFYTEEPSLYSTSFMKTFVKRDGVEAGDYAASDEDMKTQKKRGGVYVAHKRDVAIVDSRAAYLFLDTIA